MSAAGCDSSIPRTSHRSPNVQQHLSTRQLGEADKPTRIGVAEAEDVVEQEDRTLDRPEPLQLH
jgi:hypothetical protein